MGYISAMLTGLLAGVLVDIGNLSKLAQDLINNWLLFLIVLLIGTVLYFLAYVASDKFLSRKDTTKEATNDETEG